MTKEKTKVELGLDGHMACIEDITGRIGGEFDVDKPSLWRSQDEILVRLSFEKPVGNCLGFVVSLPVMDYRHQGDLLSHIIIKGRKRVREILASYEINCAREKEREVLQGALDQNVSDLKTMVGLD